MPTGARKKRVVNEVKAIDKPVNRPGRSGATGEVSRGLRSMAAMAALEGDYRKRERGCQRTEMSRQGNDRLRKNSGFRLKLAKSVPPGLKPALILQQFRHD